MNSRKLYEGHGHAYFLTFTCFRRRHLLDNDRAKRIVIAMLASQLAKQYGQCSGFMVMPNHVHALVWFPEPKQISYFMKQWKQRSSYRIKKGIKERAIEYSACFNSADPVWQPGYYCFDVYSEYIFNKKLEYIHNNPVRSGLVAKPEDWVHGSARHYLKGLPVGVKIELPGRNL